MYFFYKEYRNSLIIKYIYNIFQIIINIYLFLNILKIQNNNNNNNKYVGNNIRILLNITTHKKLKRTHTDILFDSSFFFTYIFAYSLYEEKKLQLIHNISFLFLHINICTYIFLLLLSKSVLTHILQKSSQCLLAIFLFHEL